MKGLHVKYLIVQCNCSFLFLSAHLKKHSHNCYESSSLTWIFAFTRRSEDSCAKCFSFKRRLSSSFAFWHKENAKTNKQKRFAHHSLFSTDGAAIQCNSTWKVYMTPRSPLAKACLLECPSSARICTGRPYCNTEETQTNLKMHHQCKLEGIQFQMGRANVNRAPTAIQAALGASVVSFHPSPSSTWSCCPCAASDLVSLQMLAEKGNQLFTHFQGTRLRIYPMARELHCPFLHYNQDMIW